MVRRISILNSLLLCAGVARAGTIELPKAFAGSWRTFGWAEVTAGAGTVTVANGIVANLAPTGDCIVSFRARAVQAKEPVQIWAAIRVKDRLNRYVAGLRGGLDPQVSLARYEVDRTRPEVATLATECMLHPAVPPGRFFAIAGAPIVQVQLGKGVILASKMLLNARERDPVAARLLRNMLAMLWAEGICAPASRSIHSSR